MSGATGFRRLSPLCVSAYPDESEHVYYPDKSRGIEGFSKVVVKWDPNQNMYRWVPHMDYFVQGPGKYQLETPPGYALLYQPVIRVDANKFIDYLKQGIYTKTLVIPRVTEDPETHEKTYDWTITVKDIVSRDNTEYPDPMIEYPHPLTSPYITSVPDIVELPQAWSQTNITVKLNEDAGYFSDPYEANVRVLGVSIIDIIDHREALDVDSNFTGREEFFYHLTEQVIVTPASGSNKPGVYAGVRFSIVAWEFGMTRDSSFTFISGEEDVQVNPASGLIVVHRLDDFVAVTMHWCPAGGEAYSVRVVNSFVHNGYSNVVGNKALLRVGGTFRDTAAATFVEANTVGSCTLLFSPNFIKLND